MLFVTNLTWNSFTSLKIVKRMLYLGFVLLRYAQIYNLEVSFNLHLTFLQLNAFKCSLCIKNCSFPYSRPFSSSSRQLELWLELFSISLEGSSYQESRLRVVPIFPQG